MENFAYVGAKNVLIKNKITHEVVAAFDYLSSFTLNDSQAIEYLRGGVDNERLLPFKQDRETTVTVTTATQSPDILKLQFDNEFEETEHSFDQVDKLESTTGSFTLTETPEDGCVMTVEAIDENGVRSKLEKADAAEAGKYALSGNTISCEVSVTNIVVYYKYKKTANVLYAKGTRSTVYEMGAILIAQEVGTGKYYYSQIDAPSIVIQLNAGIVANNDGSVPDHIDMTIDIIKDNKKDYTYSIAMIGQA